VMFLSFSSARLMLIDFVPSQAWFSGRLISEWITGGRKFEPATVCNLKNGKPTDNRKPLAAGQAC
jgi:hypothetical protein